MIYYKVRHEPTGKYLRWSKSENDFTCSLVDPFSRGLFQSPSIWDNEDDALEALCKTVYGTSNMRLVKFVDDVEVSAKRYSRMFECFIIERK